MKKTLLLLAVLAMAVSANAQTVTYGWEDGGAALGTYGNVTVVENSTEQALSGTSSLKISEQADSSGTPQIYVGWVTGVQDGDTITAGFYVYDNTPGVSPSGRAWGHYTSDITDIDSYAGSPGLGSGYSAGEGWDYVEYTWTVDQLSYPSATGWVIEARIYGNNDAIEDTIYVDDITITCSNDNAVIHTAAVPEPATMALLGMGALALIRRKK